MDKARQRKARAFVERWQEAEGNEDRESRSFWVELYQDVLGIESPTRVLSFERRIKGRKCDVFHEDQRVLIEMKSRGVSLDEASVRSKKAGEETPYQQALWYYNNLGTLSKPYWLITCNFDEMRVYDMREEIPAEDEYAVIRLEDLAESPHLLGFITDTSHSRLEIEKELSVKAAGLVGKLYDGFAKQYANLETDPAEQHSLNVLIVRLVFLLYAEDAGLLQEHQAFLHYLEQFEVGHMRRALLDLFEVLDTPEGQRDPYMEEGLRAFPYVNGGLFKGSVTVPQFTGELRECLLEQASAGFDWKGISPTIFGAAFESTLNPATRRSGGMHYTSIENIHKLIDALFLDDLKAELAGIEGEKVEKTRKMKLRIFQRKLAGITVFDPACGSGNFLTESYICLRHLENRVLAGLVDESQIGMDLGDGGEQIMVGIGQLYGIEINDFAVSVAKTALWIAESQAMEESQEVLYRAFEFLPLKSVNNLHCGNALRMDWNEVLPAEKCTYIVGNPPFLGYSTLDEKQSRDRESLFGKVKILDYVACWYKKASDYISEFPVRAAFVSTNSICQGQQVEPLWKPLFDSGIHIDFAYKTFIWNSEASDKAHVHVVIVGFSRRGKAEKRLFDGDVCISPDNINGYLAAAPDVFVSKRSKPLCDVLELKAGGKPTDGGYLTLSPEEREELISVEPMSKRWIRPFSMGAEFIKGEDRYCLWLEGISSEEIASMPEVAKRVENVKEFRLKSKKASTRSKAATPWLFDEVRPPKGNSYIAIPKVSSGRRCYLPMGFVTNGMIPGDKLFFISDGGLYEFGLLESQFHNAWMRLIAGRLKSDYSYSNTIVYNNFIWPDPTEEQRKRIEGCAQAVLDARKAHPGKSLADLYDPNKMPDDLLDAHKRLDAAVEAAYGTDFKGDEEKIVSHLFRLYAKLTSAQVKGDA